MTTTSGGISDGVSDETSKDGQNIFELTTLEHFMNAWAEKRGHTLGQLQRALRRNAWYKISRDLLIPFVLIGIVVLSLAYVVVVDIWSLVMGFILFGTVLIIFSKAMLDTSGLFREFEADYNDFHKRMDMKPDEQSFEFMPGRVERKLEREYREYGRHRGTQWSDAYFGALEGLYNSAAKFFTLKPLNEYATSSES